MRRRAAFSPFPLCQRPTRSFVPNLQKNSETRRSSRSRQSEKRRRQSGTPIGEAQSRRRRAASEESQEGRGFSGIGIVYSLNSFQNFKILRHLVWRLISVASYAGANFNKRKKILVNGNEKRRQQETASPRQFSDGIRVDIERQKILPRLDVHAPLVGRERPACAAGREERNSIEAGGRQAGATGVDRHASDTCVGDLRWRTEGRDEKGPS